MKPSMQVLLRVVVAAMAVTAFTISGAAAQPVGPPNALQGFSQNRDQPVKIESTSLEVRDKDKIATFFGDVHLTQGDTTLKCKTLVVFYEQNAPAGPPQAGSTNATVPPPGVGGQQSIRRVEAKGGVVVTQKDQVATGDNGIFDMKNNKVRLEGNVTVSQGQNVIKGDRLVVDMTTGVSSVECANTKSGACRVNALIVPGSVKDRGATPAPAKDAPKSPAAPLKLN